MEKIFRFFNQNQNKIIKTVLIVIFIILLIQALNKFYQNRTNNNEIISSTETATDNLKYTVIDNEKIEEKKIEEVQAVIKEFVGYCNNKEVSKAYEYITDQCKEEMYNSEELFYSNYIQSNFSTYKEVNMQAWSLNDDKLTYIVRFSEDMLSSGKVGNIIEEYYTFIKQENGKYKININNYIYGEDVNKQFSKDGITVYIIRKDVYKHYEKYQLQMINNTNNIIYLEDYINNIHLKDDRNVKYSIINEKTTKKDIILNPNGKRNFNVKFNKRYTINNTTTNIIFEDIVLDYSNTDKRKNIEIKIVD